MKIKTKTLLSLTAAVASFHLISCDTSDPESESLVTLSTRYDVDDLAANSTVTAGLPYVLFDSDLITLTPTLEDFSYYNVNYPSTDGLDDWNLSPSSSGQISIERLRYIYDGQSSGEGIISLSSTDKPTATEFDNGMLSLANTGAGREGSLSSLITTEKYPINSANIFDLTTAEKEAIREAVLSLGYIAIDNPDALAVGRGTNNSGGVTTVQVDVDNIVVLNNRVIRLTPTSTNQDIIDSNEIRGTFTIIDTYYDLALEATSTDEYYHVILARIPTFSSILQKQDIQPAVIGTFVLKLGE